MGSEARPPGQWAGEERRGGREPRCSGSHGRERPLSQAPAVSRPRRGRSLEPVGGPRAGPAPDAPRGLRGRGPGGAAVAVAAAGEGHGEEEEEEEVSRLWAGEPRGPAGRRGAQPLPSPPRRPPRGAARLGVPRGAAAAAAAAAARGAGGEAELRAARAARFPGARASLAAPPSAPRPERRPGCCVSVFLHACHFLTLFSWVLRVMRTGFPPLPPPHRAAGEGNTDDKNPFKNFDLTSAAGVLNHKKTATSKYSLKQINILFGWSPCFWYTFIYTSYRGFESSAGK
ncbi:uncharacterized protein LOC123613724 [Camelus bactrianus]|uniref:Uncharacterized protein LOC123613724 n=1 Tax=Camelus bactrianus TaxID=9837 RepID=A0AC58QF03_CAMBA